MTMTQQWSMRTHPSQRFWFQSGLIWKLMGRNSETHLRGTWMVRRKESFLRLERKSCIHHWVWRENNNECACPCSLYTKPQTLGCIQPSRLLGNALPLPWVAVIPGHVYSEKFSWPVLTQFFSSVVWDYSVSWGTLNTKQLAPLCMWVIRPTTMGLLDPTMLSPWSQHGRL